MDELISKGMWESPIDITYGKLQLQLERNVCKAVQQVNIKVDKEELIKALEYDRDQYRKGYQDALPKWIPISERLPEKDGRYWVWCEIFIVPDHVDDPCSYYGSREASYLGGHWYGDSIGEVVAWMPLPKPYNESEEKE